MSKIQMENHIQREQSAEDPSLGLKLLQERADTTLERLFPDQFKAERKGEAGENVAVEELKKEADIRLKRLFPQLFESEEKSSALTLDQDLEALKQKADERLERLFPDQFKAERKGEAGERVAVQSELVPEDLKALSEFVAALLSAKAKEVAAVLVEQGGKISLEEAESGLARLAKALAGGDLYNCAVGSELLAKIKNLAGADKWNEFVQVFVEEAESAAAQNPELLTHVTAQNLNKLFEGLRDKTMATDIDFVAWEKYLKISDKTESLKQVFQQILAKAKAEGAEGKFDLTKLSPIELYLLSMLAFQTARHLPEVEAQEFLGQVPPEVMTGFNQEEAKNMVREAVFKLEKLPEELQKKIAEITSTHKTDLTEEEWQALDEALQAREISSLLTDEQLTRYIERKYVSGFQPVEEKRKGVDALLKYFRGNKLTEEEDALVTKYLGTEAKKAVAAKDVVNMSADEIVEEANRLAKEMKNEESYNRLKERYFRLAREHDRKEGDNNPINLPDYIIAAGEPGEEKFDKEEEVFFRKFDEEEKDSQKKVPKTRINSKLLLGGLAGVTIIGGALGGQIFSSQKNKEAPVATATTTEVLPEATATVSPLASKAAATAVPTVRPQEPGAGAVWQPSAEEAARIKQGIREVSAEKVLPSVQKTTLPEKSEKTASKTYRFGLDKPGCFKTPGHAVLQYVYDEFGVVLGRWMWDDVFNPAWKAMVTSYNLPQSDDASRPEKPLETLKPGANGVEFTPSPEVREAIRLSLIEAQQQGKISPSFNFSR